MKYTFPTKWPFWNIFHPLLLNSVSNTNPSYDQNMLQRRDRNNVTKMAIKIHKCIGSVSVVTKLVLGNIGETGKEVINL